MNRCRGVASVPAQTLPVVTLNTNGVRSARPVGRFTALSECCRGANSPKVNKPPFRSRRDGVTAESAAERIHFRHTSRGHDISLYLQCEHDSPAAVRKPAMKAVELETRYARKDLRPDLELVHWSEKWVEQTN